MLTLYNHARDKSLTQMTVEELRMRYHVPETIILRCDVIKYIRDRTLTIGDIKANHIKTICVKTSLNKIYIEISYNANSVNKCFKKIDKDKYEHNFTGGFNKWLMYKDGWWYRSYKNGDYHQYHGKFIILFDHLRKIALFLEARDWYVRLYPLNMLKDIIRYIGFKLIDHYQLYNIVVQ